MERLREDILDLGQADGHVLIEGETGTGKTLVAHALHAVGAKAGKKFVLFSCAAHDEEALAAACSAPAPEDGQLPLRRGARRHAGAGRHRSAAGDPSGAASVVDQRSGDTGGDTDRGDL